MYNFVSGKVVFLVNQVFLICLIILPVRSCFSSLTLKSVLLVREELVFFVSCFELYFTMSVFLICHVLLSVSLPSPICQICLPDNISFLVHHVYPVSSGQACLSSSLSSSAKSVLHALTGACTRHEILTCPCIQPSLVLP